MSKSSHTVSAQVSLTTAVAALVLATGACFTFAAAGSPERAFACEHVHASTKSLSKSDARSSMRCLINGTRLHNGLGKLRSNGDLAAVAQKHTRVMKRKGCFAHQCGGEDDPYGRIRGSGYLSGGNRYSFAENIAYSELRNSSPRSIFRAWMNSSGHRANILGSSSEHIGIGVSSTRHETLWTTDFGSRG